MAAFVAMAFQDMPCVSVRADGILLIDGDKGFRPLASELAIIAGARYLGSRLTVATVGGFCAGSH
jgi:hypothetical protein